MKTSLDFNDREFLDRLRRQGTATVQEICAELGVTATAVRQRLVRLQGKQLVSREIVRTGRGRPHYTYGVTGAGIRELGDNYADLAMTLWHELQNIEESDVRARVVGMIKDSLVRRYRTAVTSETLEGRVKELMAVLVERGFDIEVDSTGPLPILRENNCPYPELASFDRGICELEESVFKQVLGTDVKLTRCCLDGDHCCEFQTVGEH